MGMKNLIIRSAVYDKSYYICCIRCPYYISRIR